MPEPSDQREPEATAGEGEVTALLAASARGETDAMDRLIPLVYDSLRAIAHRRLGLERTGHTLDTTAVVHEAYLRLVDQSGASWRDRTQFFAFAGRVIRNLLIDYGRERGAQKRGGGAILLPLNDQLAGAPERTVELVALDEALTRLGGADPRLERLVEYRFFAGLTMEETAEIMGVSLTTVERDWRRARAYLFAALHE